MLGFRLSAQTPPEPERVTDAVVSRFEHVFEVDPALMRKNVRQQDIPNWDLRRIVDSRWEHLAWMHEHFADSVISGEELLAELEGENGPTSRRGGTAGEGN